jgi:hypothetical protein
MAEIKSEAVGDFIWDQWPTCSEIGTSDHKLPTKSLKIISGRILRVEPYVDRDWRANVERTQAPRKIFERGALW